MLERDSLFLRHTALGTDHAVAREANDFGNGSEKSGERLQCRAELFLSIAVFPGAQESEEFCETRLKGRRADGLVDVFAGLDGPEAQMVVDAQVVVAEMGEESRRAV